METTDAISASLKGRKDAFGILIDRYSDLVYRVALKMLGSKSEALDIVQETFLSAWRKLGHFDPALSFPNWLYRIAVNKCHDELRRRKRSQWRDLGEQHLENAGIELRDPGNTLDGKETLELIRTLSAGLSPKQRIAFVLVDLEERSHEEAASLSGLSRDQLKSNLNLARRKMADKLERYGYHEQRKPI